MKPEPVPATLSSPHLPNVLTCVDAPQTRSDLRVQNTRLVEWSMKAQEEVTERTAYCDPEDPQHWLCSGVVRLPRTDGSGVDAVPCACGCHRDQEPA